MAESFVPNKNVNDVIASEALGHIYATGTEPWLGRSVALGCLQLCRVSPVQANVWITGQGFEYMISFIEIRPEKLQGIGK